MANFTPAIGVFGWQGENKGRVYTFESKSEEGKVLVKETQEILANGVGDDVAKLVKLLDHQDRRVRLEAQFALVRAGDETPLQASVTDGSVFKRLHAIWGLGQLTRTHLKGELSNETRGLMEEMLRDQEPEIRAAAIAQLGELNSTQSRELAEQLVSTDENLRVRQHAALALAKIGKEESVSAIRKMLVENDNNDPILRHSGAMALAGIVGRLTPDERAIGIQILSKDGSPQARLAYVVALRKLHHSIALKNLFSKNQFKTLTDGVTLAPFLNDPDPMVVLEAARAIHDLPIESDMSALASLGLDKIPGATIISGQGEVFAAPPVDALTRRIINAKFLVGGAEHAKQLADYAKDKNGDVDLSARRDSIAFELGRSEGSG